MSQDSFKALEPAHNIDGMNSAQGTGSADAAHSKTGLDRAYEDAVSLRAGAPGSHPAFDELVRIIWRLRQPDGCPWDRKQTHASIASNMIEEAYEAVDCIETGSTGHLLEELGDVLLQVVLHAQIASDEGNFDIDAICQSVSKKLVRRHPHVFGSAAKASTAEEALASWSSVKLAEHAQENGTAPGVGAGAGATGAAGTAVSPSASTAGTTVPPTATRSSILDSVPSALPALTAAQKISRKAAAAGFEWDSVDEVWQQVRSEIDEYNNEQPGSDAAQAEFGDILFALVNVARKQGIDAEAALRSANAKFRRRWLYMEQQAWAGGRGIEDVSRDRQEELWAQAKEQERAQH